METAQKATWTRILAEGAAIVVSILLAFGIEAWWTDRQERQDEIVVIEALLQEFEAKKLTLKNLERFNENILAATNKLIDASLSLPNHNLTEDTINKQLSYLWWWNAPSSWNVAALDAVLAGNGISRISNPRVRILLAQWPDRFNFIKETARLDQEYYRDRVMPYLTKHASLAHIANVGSVDPNNPEVVYEPAGKYDLNESFAHDELLADREFRNVLIEKAVRQEDILNLAFVGLEEELDETIRALQAELKR